MTIASEIARLQGVKADILGAIAEKKVDVPSGAMLADAPDLIRSIKSGINVKIGQGVYPAVKIGNQLWLARNLDEELGTLGVDEWYYNGRSEKTRLNSTERIFAPAGTAGDFYGQMEPYVSEFIREKKIVCSGRVSISEPQDKDIEVRATFAFNSLTSFFRIGIFYIPKGQTSVDFSVTEGTLTPSNINSVQFFFRTDFSTAAKNYDFTAENIRINIGTTDCGTNAITYTKALANEATAKSKDYGRLYTWNNVNKNLSKLGLTKWRWPTKADFEGLVAIDPTGSIFRDKSFGDGTNETGLSILPTGYEGRSRGGLGVESYIQSSQIYSVSSAYGFRTRANNISVGSWDGVYGRSIRLVMDLNEDGTIPDSNIVLEDVPATTAEPLALASEPIVTEEES